MKEEERPLEAHVKILVAGLLGTIADHGTTHIALKYPELYEANPMANFGAELTITEVGGTAIYGLGRMLKLPDLVSFLLGLVPSGVAWAAAINNLAWIAYAHRNYYPWKELPILYPE